MKNVFYVIIALVVFSSCTNSTQRSTQAVDIQLIRNATLKLNYNGSTFLVDPVLSPKHSFMSFVIPDTNLNPTVDLTLPVSEITEGIDAILLTHAHDDHFHFSDEALKAIDHSLPLLAQPFDAEALGKSSFSNISLIDTEFSFKGTSITRTHGVHGPADFLPVLGEVSGYILQAKNHPTIYIVGDCLWDDEIKNTIKKYNPDIIITNSGGAEYGGNKILMDEQSTIELARFAPNAKVIAVHMDALDHCKTSRSSLAKAAKAEGIRIHIPKDGESLTL